MSGYQNFLRHNHSLIAGKQNKDEVRVFGSLTPLNPIVGQKSIREDEQLGTQF
jgi:hypothetical protein